METDPRQVSSGDGIDLGGADHRDGRDRRRAGIDNRLEKTQRRKASTEGEYEDGGLFGITVELGKRGSGKSTRMGTVCRIAKRLIFFDGRGASALSRNFFDQFRFDATVHQPGELKAFLRTHLNSGFRVLYQPLLTAPAWNAGEPDHSADLIGHFNAVVHLAIACGRLILAFDELDRVTSANWMPAGLAYLVNQGRHVQISMIATARRPQQIPREFTSQAHLIEIFRMTEPRDLRYLAEFIGDATAARLPHLAAFSFLRWEETEGVSVVDRNGRETLVT